MVLATKTSYVKKLIYLLVLTTSISAVFGQNIKFGHYDETDGLSHNSVRHIVQDANGFLWLGTFSGLNRFDGYEFTSYLSTSETSLKLNNDDVTALELDEESNHLWIGTRNGLTRLEMSTYHFKTFLPEKNNPNSLGDTEIRSVLIDKLKRVWVGTKTQGLFLYTPKDDKFQKVPIEGFEYVKEIFEDKKGNIWVGTYGKAAIAKIVLDKKGNINHTVNYDLSVPNSATKNPYVNFIYEDHKSDIFVGTRQGLYKFDAKKDKFDNLHIEDETVRDQLGPYFVSVVRSPEGRYWVGTLGGLLVCDSLEDIATGDFEWHFAVLSDDTSLVDNLISSLYFDKSGILWIGTEDGLDKYDPYENQFKLNKDISQHINNQVPRIRGFSKTFDHKVIVATRYNGLFIYENDKITPLYSKPYDIASIYTLDGKTFYCGLWNGQILVYDYIENSSKKVDVGFENAPILAFEAIDEKTFIVGSFGEGALLLNRNSLQPLSESNSLLPGSSINKIVLDKKRGKLWFATEEGVASYEMVTRGIRKFHADAQSGNSLPHNNVSDIIIDKQGDVWAATRLGLGVYDEKSDDFNTINQPQELIGKWVTDMALDDNGNIWLNMNNSIAKLQPKSKVVNTYQVTSGNRLDVFSSSGFYNVSSSNIFLGGKNGVVYFSPYEILENQWAPKPIISEVKVQNKTIYPGLKFNGHEFLINEFNFSKKLSLNYINRNFSLQFSAPSYANEGMNKFEYQLVGFDEDWVTVNSNARTVQYTNLYPKDYVFKMRASNSNGYWSEIASYAIKIMPPFWLTYKAFLLALLLVASFVYIARRGIKNRLKLKQELLTEKLKQERNEKLNNEKLRFFTNISHELRTPLTLILGPAKDLLLQSENTKNEYTSTRSRLIHQNANRLLNLVNQILDFRKAQTGELKLQVSETNILEQATNTFKSFKELARHKKINFNFNCENEEIIGWLDKDKLDKVLYNLLSNAIKFTNEHGTVDLFLSVWDDERDYLTIEVSDDGIGIPKISQKNIFSRFYQTRNSKESTTGSGIGLSLVKSLVKLHKGKISFQSEHNEGTIFTVKLPIARQLYTTDEVRELLPGIEGADLTIPEQQKKIVQATHLKEKLVVIEDNAELRDYLVNYLSDYYKVYGAENGKEGLRICRQIKPILCVSDVMMPVKNGLEFCHELKSDQFISHIPVILLTALSENEDKSKGYDVGADGYLVKPFDPSLLKTLIVNIVNSRAALKAKFSGEVESEVSLLTHSPIDAEFMAKISGIINNHITESTLSTAFLCKELGMSSSKLYRKIKELTDLAPNEFIRTVRLKKSAVLLKTRKYNVSEVTDLIGFNDPLYFSRCFKKQFGFPPSKLIKDTVKIDVN